MKDRQKAKATTPVLEKPQIKAPGGHLVRTSAHVQNQLLNPITDDRQLPLWDLMDIRNEKNIKTIKEESCVLGLDFNFRQYKAFFAILKLLDGTGYTKDEKGDIVSYKGNLPPRALTPYESPDKREHPYIPSISITKGQFLDAYGVNKRESKRGKMERSVAESKEAFRALNELAEIKPVIVYKRKYYDENGHPHIDRIERAPVPIIKIDKGWKDITPEEDYALDVERAQSGKAPTHLKIEADPILIDQIGKNYYLKPSDFYEQISYYSEGKSSKYVTHFMEWVFKTASDIYRSKDNTWKHEIGSLLLANKAKMTSMIKARKWANIREKLDEGIQVAISMGYLKKHETIPGTHFKESKEVFYFDKTKFQKEEKEGPK